MEIIALRPQLHLIRPTFGQVYLWQDGSQLTMVDTGIPGCEDDLSAAFAELGYRRGDLRRVVVTHGHEDHAGSAAAVRAWGDVEVLAHSADAPVIRGERPRAEPTLTVAEMPLYDQVTATMPDLPACAVDTELGDGDRIDFGGGAQVTATPLGPFNTDRERSRESVAMLAQTPAEVVCFGHGDPLADEAGAAAWRELGRRCRSGTRAVPDPLGDD